MRWLRFFGLRSFGKSMLWSREIFFSSGFSCGVFGGVGVFGDDIDAIFCLHTTLLILFVQIVCLTYLRQNKTPCHQGDRGIFLAVCSQDFVSHGAKIKYSRYHGYICRELRMGTEPPPSPHSHQSRKIDEKNYDQMHARAKHCEYRRFSDFCKEFHLTIEMGISFAKNISFSLNIACNTLNILYSRLYFLLCIYCYEYYD